MYIEISAKIRKKLKDEHGVSEKEIRQCFVNRYKGFLRDTRDQHDTIPPTEWFVSLTNKNRELKVVFMNIDGVIHIKSAFEPNSVEKRIYDCVAR